MKDMRPRLSSKVRLGAERWQYSYFAICQTMHNQLRNLVAHLFRFTFDISLRNAGPSSGFRSSNAHKRSSETLFKSRLSTPMTLQEARFLPHASSVVVKLCRE